MNNGAKAAITAVVLTKNEEAAVERCVLALGFCDQVIVVDSASTDRTVELAERAGAEVITFAWDGRYPKKKQWGMQHPRVRHDWVLHIDADEIVPPDLAAELVAVVNNPHAADVRAAEGALDYYFLGRRLRYGHRVTKRFLVRKDYASFPEVGDLSAPGITEVEGHYQPRVDGSIHKLSARLIHDDPDPLADWISRHNRYSDWEAHLRFDGALRTRIRGERSVGGRIFDRLPFKPLIFFVYSYLVRLGFLDGRAGLDYAVGLSWYYWTIEAKVRETRTRNTWTG